MLKIKNFDKCAILLRGHHFRNDRFGYFCDGRIYLDSYSKSIIKPLKSKYKIVDIYIVTFPSPILNEVCDHYKPRAIHVDLVDELKDQRETFLRGLDLIQDNYDRYFFLRFDCWFKQPISSWDIWKQDGIYFPWREYKGLWEQHRRVGDMIHIVDNAFFDAFRKGLRETDMEERLDFVKKEHRVPNFHKLYDSVDAPKLFICEGYFDSNTIYKTKECCNPLYYIKHRPYHFEDVKQCRPTCLFI